MLQPDRASRMVAPSMPVDQALPGWRVIDKLVKATFDATTSGTYEAKYVAPPSACWSIA